MAKLLWGLVILSGVFYPAACISYRRRLKYRKLEIERILKGGTLSAYANAFSGASPTETVERLFQLYYAWQTYILSISLNILVSCGACAAILMRFGWQFGFPDIEARVAYMPLSSAAALAGAFVWGLYDIMQRYETVDLSPVSLHYVWLRMLIVAALAPLVSLPAADSLHPLIGFAIGAFPLSALQDFVKRQAKDRGLSSSAEPTEAPTLNLLQGMTDGMLDRLLNEGYEGIQQLANTDPFKLLLKTNLDWKTVLDLIDQSILFDYTGPKGTTLRAIGIRGSIELATIQQNLNSNKLHEVAEGSKLIALVAGKLGEDEAGVRNLVKNAFEDVQVNLVWDLWGDEEVKKGGGAEDQLEEPSGPKTLAAGASDGPRA